MVEKRDSSSQGWLSYDFWITYMTGATIFMILLGAFWSIFGMFDPFGIYSKWMAQTFWQQDTVPKDALKAFQFVLGPFGATNSGYFILQLFLVRVALKKKEKWAFHAILAAFFFWFILDTTMSLTFKAFFNIILANISSLVLFVPAFLGLQSHLKSSSK